MAYLIRQPQFGCRLRQLRILHRLSQRELASDTVSASYVSLIEAGIRTPSTHVVMHFARVLRVPLGELVNSTTPHLDELDGNGNGEPPRPSTFDEIDRLVRESLARGHDPAEARAQLVAEYERATALEDPTAMVRCATLLQSFYALEHDGAARLGLLADLSSVAMSSGMTEMAIRALTDYASAARDVGQYAQAQQQVSVATQLVERHALGGSQEHIRLLAVRVSILADTGDWTNTHSQVAELLALVGGAESYWRGRALWSAGVALGRSGDRDGAVRCLREATGLLADPGTPLSDWARFLRSAASALLDAEAELSEVERYLRASQITAGVPGEGPLTTILRARYALVCGDGQTAWQLSTSVSEDTLCGYDLVRLMVTRSRAAQLLGRTDDAMQLLRRAAKTAEELSAFHLAARTWRELDDLRSA